MTDQLERDLATVLHDHAAATDVPPAPIALLVSAGERRAVVRRRRRSLATVCATAAAVIAVALPVALHFGHHSAPAPVAPSHGRSTPAAPTTLTELPQGAPPSVPYLQDGALHVDGKAIPTKANAVVSAGDTVLASRWHDSVITWSVLRDGALDPIPRMKNIDPHAISPDGTFAVAESWPDKKHTVLTAVDPKAGTPIGRPLTLNAPYAACCGGGQEVQILGVDGHRTVYFSDRRGVAAWWPGAGKPVELEQIAAMAATPGGLVIQNDDSTGRLVTADRDGKLHTVAHLPVNQSFTMSEDGSMLAYGTPEQVAAKLGVEAAPERVVDVSTGRSTDLVVPGDAQYATPVAFEGDDAVLLEVLPPAPDSTQHTYLIRCAATGGACERAVDLGTGDQEDPVAGWRY